MSFQSSIIKCSSLNSLQPRPSSCDSSDCSIMPKSGIMIDSLPPPKPYVKSFLKPAELILTVRTTFPYRILDASQDLCARFLLSNGKIKGRAISILYGPGTDQSCIPSAIKNMLTDISSIPAWIPTIQIYGQDQQPHTMRVECRLNNDSPQTACLLLFEARSQLAWPAWSPESKQLRVAVRSRYNFFVGLEMHLDNLRHIAPAAPAAAEPDRCDDDAQQCLFAVYEATKR